MTKNKMKFLSPTIKGSKVLFVCLLLLREQFIDISFVTHGPRHDMLSTYLHYVYTGAHSALICHVLVIYCIAGKFDGELNLAVWQLGLNLPMCNDAKRNDVMYAVVFLAPSSAPLHKHFARSVTKNISSCTAPCTMIILSLGQKTT